MDAGFVVLSRNPGASLADVAAEAGVGRATLHRQFASRTDLISALAERALTDLADAVSAATEDAASYGEALQKIMLAVIPLAQCHMFLTQDVALRPEVQARVDDDARALRDLIDAAKAEGAIRGDLPTEWVAQAFDHLVYASWDMIRRQEATPRQAADLAWSMFSKGASA